MSYKKRLSLYERGKRWGYAIFNSNLQLFGKLGLRKSDATAFTCGRYARDTRIIRTKSGKYLDNSTRSAYRGIQDGIYEAWRKAERHFNG